MSLYFYSGAICGFFLSALFLTSPKNLPLPIVLFSIVLLLIFKLPDSLMNNFKKSALFLTSIFCSFFIFYYRYEPPQKIIENISNKNDFFILQIIDEQGFSKGIWKAKSEIIEKEKKTGVFIDLKSYRKLDFTTPGTIITGDFWIKKTMELPDSSYKKYLINERIYGTATITWTNKIKVLKEPSGYLYHYHLIKKAIWHKLETHIGENGAGLSFALLTGDKTKIPAIVKENFRTTGTYHVLAVSGMHAGILIALFFSFFRFIGLTKRRIWTIMLSIVFPFYLCLTGFQVSIVRTYLMLVVAKLVSLTGRKTSPLNIFMFILIVYIAIQPKILFSLSFQLSFSAVFGILLAIRLATLYNIKSPILNYIIVSTGAQLATSPFLIFNFGYLNYFTILYNIPISFLIPLTLIYSLFHIILPSPFSLITGEAIKTLNALIYFFMEKTAFKFDFFNIPLQGNFNICSGFALLTAATLGLAIYFTKQKQKRENLENTDVAEIF